MPSIKLAKRSAAFKACKLLYENGELNENLMPMTVKRNFENINQVYFNHYENFKEGNFQHRHLLLVH